MSKLSGNVKQFGNFLTMVFPGGGLWLVASEAELKRLLIELTAELLQSNNCRRIRAARMIGINATSSGNVWVFSPTVLIDKQGKLMDVESSPILWLERPQNSSNLLINDAMQCSIATPLDSGEAFVSLCDAVQAFMPEHFIPALTAVSCCIMGASYIQVIQKCGCIGVPFLFGDPGSCKSEALKCGLALFGAHKTHMFNSQTTSSFLFPILKETTIPVVVDDVSDKAQDTWEELVIDAYNNTGRGTRSYSCETFCSLPILSANWRFTSSRQRAHTRVIAIPFFEHTDEPEAHRLFAELNTARLKASASTGEMIQMIQSQEIFPQITKIFATSHVRFKMTMTVFMYFFLEVSRY